MSVNVIGAVKTAGAFLPRLRERLDAAGPPVGRDRLGALSVDVDQRAPGALGRESRAEARTCARHHDRLAGLSQSVHAPGIHR